MGKSNQSRPGFELVSPCSFPTAITTTPRAPPSEADVGGIPLEVKYVHSHCQCQCIFFNNKQESTCGTSKNQQPICTDELVEATFISYV